MTQLLGPPDLGRSHGIFGPRHTLHQVGGETCETCETNRGICGNIYRKYMKIYRKYWNIWNIME